MTPNKQISKEKQDKIQELSEKYSIGSTAKFLGIHRDTVKKYLDKDDD
jgi:predicted transcriptional regulator